MTKPLHHPSLRLYCPEPLVQDARIDLDAEQTHYLFTVMRRSQGDAVGLFNARDGEFRANLERTGKKTALAHLTEQVRLPQTPEQCHISLLFAPIKRGPSEAVVRQSTELGVHALTLTLTDHCQNDRLKLDRLAAIAMEACEQCERLEPPSIFGPTALGQTLSALNKDTPLIVMAESGTSTPLVELAHLLSDPAKPAALAILVGPEGGFSQQEFETLRLRQNCYFAGLGPRILKAETAAIHALGIIQAICGDGDQAPRT